MKPFFYPLVILLLCLLASAFGGGSDDLQGTNSGNLIQSLHPEFGFAPVSHPRQNISVYNKVRITYKSKPNHASFFQIFTWNNGKKIVVSGPRTRFLNGTTGQHILDIYFPEAGVYTVQIVGWNGDDPTEKNLFHYIVTARAGFAEGDLPAVCTPRFAMDGLQLLSTDKRQITARRELVITIKKPAGFRLWAQLRHNNAQLNEPWSSTREDNDGTMHFILKFPKTGTYTLQVFGENPSTKSINLYLGYAINCVDVYSKDTEPVALFNDFHTLGFTVDGLSHKQYNLTAGDQLMVTLRGKPGVILSAVLENKSGGKFLRKIPRAFAVAVEGTYQVFAYFPEAGSYELYIEGDVANPGDSNRKTPVIARYKITAGGGSSDRALDKKLGLYYSEDQYKKPNSNFGSAGKLLWATDLGEAERISRSQNRILLILHGASWCGFCKQLRNETFAHPDVVTYARDRFVIFTIDTDKTTDNALYNQKYKQYQTSIPSTTFVAPDGKVLQTIGGYSPGEHFCKILKNIVALKDGLVDRYEALHQQGNTEYSFKLVDIYRNLGQKAKAKALMLELISGGKVAADKLPEYYHTIAEYSYGSELEKYYLKVITDFSHNIGFYWYYSAYKLALDYFGNPKTADALDRGESKSIAFLAKYLGNDAYSPAWRSHYSDLIKNIKKFCTKKRKEKGWTRSDGNAPAPGDGLVPTD